VSHSSLDKAFIRKLAGRLAGASVSSPTERYRNDVSIEWTDEGPRVSGCGVVLTPTESNALLDRWTDKIGYFLARERNERGKDDPSVDPKANFLAILRAFGDTYHRVPTEEETRELSTELAKKLDLFYVFVEIMHSEASGSGKHQE